MSTIETALNKLNLEYFNIVASGDSHATRKQVTALEKEIGYRLPEDFKLFLCSPLSSLLIEVTSEFWPSAKPKQKGEAWEFQNGFQVFGIGASIPEWIDLRVHYADFMNKGIGDFLPFMKRSNDSSRYVCNAQGHLFLWNSDGDVFTKQRRSFESLVAYEIAQLDARRAQKMKLKKRK
jgi:hypothetical protein